MSLSKTVKVSAPYIPFSISHTIQPATSFQKDFSGYYIFHKSSNLYLSC